VAPDDGWLRLDDEDEWAAMLLSRWPVLDHVVRGPPVAAPGKCVSECLRGPCWDYAGCGQGAALLDWAADAAKRDHNAALIHIDVWTTNLELHAYYEDNVSSGCRTVTRPTFRIIRHRRCSNGQRIFQARTKRNWAAP
jgi:hypothetical protein